MVGKSSKDAGQRGAGASRRQSPRNKGENSFGREYSLKEDLAIKRVFGSGKKYKGSCLTIYYYGSGNLPLKVAIKIRKNVGSAPKRNKFKRIIREIIRTNKEIFQSRGHLVISVNSDPGNDSLFKAIKKDLLNFAQTR